MTFSCCFSDFALTSPPPLVFVRHSAIMLDYKGVLLAMDIFDQKASLVCLALNARQIAKTILGEETGTSLSL